MNGATDHPLLGTAGDLSLSADSGQPSGRPGSQVSERKVGSGPMRDGEDAAGEAKPGPERPRFAASTTPGSVTSKRTTRVRLIPPETTTPALFGSDHRRADTSERALGDFTTTPAILPLVPLAILIGVIGAGISLGAALHDRVLHQPLLLPAPQRASGLAQRQHARCHRHHHPHRRRSDRRA